MTQKALMTFKDFERDIIGSKSSYYRERYLILPLEEKVRIFEIAKPIMNRVPNIGTMTVLEFISQLGTYLNDPRGYERARVGG